MTVGSKVPELVKEAKNCVSKKIVLRNEDREFYFMKSLWIVNIWCFFTCQFFYSGKHL